MTTVTGPKEAARLRMYLSSRLRGGVPHALQGEIGKPGVYLGYLPRESHFCCYVGVPFVPVIKPRETRVPYRNRRLNTCCFGGTPMPCTEMKELEARNERYNELSFITMSLLSVGRGEFSKWHRAGRARLAYTMQMHRQSCGVCRCQG